MTREEAITKYIVPAIEKTWNDKRCKEILEALEQEPCDDCISRQDVLDLCDSTDPEYKVVHFKEDVQCLPSVNPQPKTGHWIMTDDTNWYDAYFKCSCCGREIGIPYDLRNQVINKYPYCHCGAKMQEVEE